MDSLLDYIPIVGDLYRAGKMGWKVGSLLGDYWYGDNQTLTKGVEHLNNAIDSDNPLITKAEAEKAITLFNQSECDKKYQLALICYLRSHCYYLIAISNIVIGNNDVKKNFNNAISDLNSVCEVEATLLTTKKDTILELQEEAKSHILEIKDVKDNWIKLDKEKHPWKYRLRWIILVIILVGLGICVFMYTKETSSEYEQASLRNSYTNNDNYETDENEDIKLNEIQEEPTTYKIKYFVKGDTPHNNLYANINGQEYEIPIPGDICIDIITQGDFDNDGINDVLVKDIVACYGNACGDSFFFVCYKGEGDFKISEEFGSNIYEEPIVENWNDNKSVILIYFDRDKILTRKDRYICEKGAAVKVESIKMDKANAIKEIIASDFHDGNEEATLRLTIDLDENGIEDYIDCKYWQRCDAVVYSIILNGEDLGECNTGVYRIGVANSKTNGMHDLIWNGNTIIKWDGEKYE